MVVSYNPLENFDNISVKIVTSCSIGWIRIVTGWKEHNFNFFLTNQSLRMASIIEKQKSPDRPLKLE